MTAPLVFRAPKRTYLQWLRSAPEATLERAERVRLLDEDWWRKTRPDDAVTLDALIGKVVRLRSQRTTHGGKARVRGEPFLVVDAWFGLLHGVEPALEGELSVPILLRLEWVYLDTSTPFVILETGGLRAPEAARGDGDDLAQSSAGPPPAPN